VAFDNPPEFPYLVKKPAGLWTLKPTPARTFPFLFYQLETLGGDQECVVIGKALRSIIECMSTSFPMGWDTTFRDPARFPHCAAITDFYRAQP